MAGPFGWDYPAGAEHDPNAPWNQSDDSMSDFRVEFMKKYPIDFQIRAENESGGFKEWSGPELVDECDDEEIVEYFSQFKEYSKDIVNDKEFLGWVDKLFDSVVPEDFEWDYPEDLQEDEGDYYYQLRKDEPDLFK